MDNNNEEQKKGVKRRSEEDQVMFEASSRQRQDDDDDEIIDLTVPSASLDKSKRQKTSPEVIVISDEKEEDCGICWGSFPSDSIVSLHCSHKFCKDCLVKQQGFKGIGLANCGICRADFTDGDLLKFMPSKCEYCHRARFVEAVQLCGLGHNACRSCLERAVHPCHAYAPVSKLHAHCMACAMNGNIVMPENTLPRHSAAFSVIMPDVEHKHKHPTIVGLSDVNKDGMLSVQQIKEHLIKFKPMSNHHPDQISICYPGGDEVKRLPRDAYKSKFTNLEARIKGTPADQSDAVPIKVLFNTGLSTEKTCYIRMPLRYSFWLLEKEFIRSLALVPSTRYTAEVYGQRPAPTYDDDEEKLRTRSLADLGFQAGTYVFVKTL